jgi:hypothetical protein
MVKKKEEREREEGWNFIISGQFDVHKGPNQPSHFMLLQSDTGVWAYHFYVRYSVYGQK